MTLDEFLDDYVRRPDDFWGVWREKQWGRRGDDVRLFVRRYCEGCRHGDERVRRWATLKARVLQMRREWKAPP